MMDTYAHTHSIASTSLYDFEFVYNFLVQDLRRNWQSEPPQHGTSLKRGNEWKPLGRILMENITFNCELFTNKGLCEIQSLVCMLVFRFST